MQSLRALIGPLYLKHSCQLPLHRNQSLLNPSFMTQLLLPFATTPTRRWRTYGGYSAMAVGWEGRCSGHYVFFWFFFHVHVCVPFANGLLSVYRRHYRAMRTNQTYDYVQRMKAKYTTFQHPMMVFDAMVKPVCCCSCFYLLLFVVVVVVLSCCIRQLVLGHCFLCRSPFYVVITTLEDRD
jgi:hypothetical protein